MFTGKVAGRQAVAWKVRQGWGTENQQNTGIGSGLLRIRATARAQRATRVTNAYGGTAYAHAAERARAACFRAPNVAKNAPRARMRAAPEKAIATNVYEENR